jgi:hypothetical protein
MQTPLYVKKEDSSPEKSFNPSLLPENRLDLLPEHVGQIGSAFIQQLSLASLNSRDVQILSAIYTQTIGFDKREDDMNGRRLEQLTGIRPDHANASVRRLEGWNIIVTRSGDYGKWMSVNYDFSHWGKAYPESQTNEPYGLLSTCYQPLLDDEEQFSLHVPPPSLHNETAIKAVIKAETIETLSVEALPVEELQVKQRVPILPPISSSISKPPVITNTVQLPNKEAVAPVVNHAIRPQTEALEIRFPATLTKALCQKIGRYLTEIKVREQAQRLVDYFAHCMQKGKILAPLAYFISLKNRLLNNQLDLPEDPKIVADNKKEQLKLNQLRQEYQEAITDQQQLKQQIETISNEKNSTFAQAAEQIGHTQIWQQANKRVENIKQSLQMHYQATDSHVGYG